MTVRMRRFLPLAALLAALTACGAGPEPGAATDTTTPSTAPPPTESDSTTMPSNPQDQLPIVAPAVSDLAGRLGAPPEDIEIVSAEEVTWPDGSLGCPEPDMSYTQALIDGSKVVLKYEDRVFVYHAGDDAQPFLCASDEKDGGHEMVPPPGYNS
jgi:hypothetical protein